MDRQLDWYITQGRKMGGIFLCWYQLLNLMLVDNRRVGKMTVGRKSGVLLCEYVLWMSMRAGSWRGEGIDVSFVMG